MNKNMAIFLSISCFVTFILLPLPNMRVYAIAMFVVPTLYILYKLFQRCMTYTLDENTNEWWPLVIITYFFWMILGTSRYALQYPYSSILILTLNLLGLLLTFLYVYNHIGNIKKKTPCIILIVFFVMVIFSPGYHLITGHSVFRYWNKFSNASVYTYF